MSTCVLVYLSLANIADLNPDIIPPMNPRRFLVLFLLISLLFVGLWLPANAAPLAQVQYSTPTPGPDGRIIYIAQPGDTCIKITLLHGISEQTFRQLNNRLDENCTIIEGQEYLIGLASAAAGTATAGPSPTPLPPTASPTPFTGTTEICVLLFDDQNGDAMRQESEPALSGGAVSVTENNGEYSAAQDTVINSDPEAYQGVCFTDVPGGTYTASVAIPDNYNATMVLSYELKVNPGDIAFVDFGAQSRETTVSSSDGSDGSVVSPALGIFGLLMLLGGGGLGYYAWRSGKPDSRLAGRSRLPRQ